MSLKYLEHYHIIREIGSGTHGEVYEALDKRFNKKVAIKSLKKEYCSDNNIRSLFIKEANEYLYLKHKNIVNLHDLIVKIDRIYIIMEYVQGITLEDYINLNTRINNTHYYDSLKNIFLQIIDGLHYAHSQNKLHLDIKPSNVLLSGDLNVKIADFGVSHSINENKEQRIGSPLYMSPEQVNIQELGVYTDIYNLGVTMTESLLKYHPYEGPRNKDDLFKWIIKKENYELPSNGVYNKWNPIIKKSTQKNISSRYNSCIDLYRDIYLLPL